MKIAISSTGKKGDSLLDSRFGRCEYFYIYDTDKKDVTVIDNDGLSANGGAGIAASNQIINQNIDVLITGKLGPNAFNIIDASGIKAYTCGCVSVDMALEKYKNAQLDEITKSGAPHQG